MCKVSVIVPVYNVEEYLLRCVKSILEQSYTNIELILVDDGSSDKSGAMCDTLALEDKRIKVIHQSNKGLSGARNTGLGAATGDYIAFVDSDDWIDRDYISYMVQTAQTYHCDVVSSPFEITHVYRMNAYKKKKFHVRIMEREACLKWYLASAIRSGKNDVSCCTKLYRRSMLEKVRFIETIHYEDVLFNWTVLNNTDRYAYANRAGYYYFSRGGSITREFSKKTFDLLKGAEYIALHPGRYGRKCENLIKQYESRVHYSLCIKMLRAKKVDSALLRKELQMVKKNFWELLASPLSLFRKLILIMIKLVPTKIWIMHNGLPD